MIVEVVTQLEQGAYVFPILRVRFAARYAAAAIVGTAGIRTPALFVVGDDGIGSVAVVFGFFTETAGINHQCVQTQPSSCGGYAAEFLAVASDIAAFNAQVVGFFFGNIVTCGFGFIVDGTTQCTAAGFERVRAFGHGYFREIFRFGSIAVGVEVAVCAEQLLERFRRPAFCLCQSVHVDGDAVFIDAAYGKAVGAGAPTFDDADARIVAHQVAFVGYHLFVQCLTVDFLFAEFLDFAAADDFDFIQALMCLWCGVGSEGRESLADNGCQQYGFEGEGHFLPLKMY